MQPLPGRTKKAVAIWVVAKLVLTEQARSDRRTTLRAGHVRIHPGLLAGLDVLHLEVAPIGHDRDPLHTEDLFGGLGGFASAGPGRALGS